MDGPLAYSYVRLSSGRQKDGDGERRQDWLAQKYTEEHGLRLDGTLRDLGLSGYTGANRHTGALKAFLEKVRDNKVPEGSLLLVESLDRLSREDVLTALGLFQEIINAGITIVTLADKFRYSRESITANWTQLIISLAIMSRAHEESATKGRRQIENWQKKRNGISRQKLTSRTKAWLVLNEDRTAFRVVHGRVALVQRILMELASGIGREKIAQRLNREEIAPWGHGRCWHGGTIQKITDDRAVVGWFQPHKIERRIVKGCTKLVRVPVGNPIPDYYPVIVSEDLYLKARAASEKRSVRRLMVGSRTRQAVRG